MINISLHIRKLPPATERGRGYSDLNFGQLKSEVFIWGGTLIWTLLNSNLKSSLGGGILIWTLVNSNLKSSFGGYSDSNFGHLKSEVFILGGGTLVWNSREGCSGEFGQKFTVHTETCLCITESLSHTTYVETNCNSMPLVRRGLTIFKFKCT